MSLDYVKTLTYCAAVQISGVLKLEITAQTEDEAKTKAAGLCAEANFGDLTFTNICDMLITKHNCANNSYRTTVMIEGYYAVKNITAPDKTSASRFAYQKACEADFGSVINPSIATVYCTNVISIQRKDAQNNV